MSGTLRADGHPLSGLCVTTLADRALPSFGRTLAEFGADVVCLEAEDHPPDPDGLRRFLDRRGKTYLPLPTAAIDLDARLRESDVLVVPADGGPVNLEDAARRHPHLVIAVVSDFGSDNERSDWTGSEAVYKALNGALARSGEPGGRPVLPPGDIFVQAAAYEFTWAVLVALFDRSRSDDAPTRAAVLDCAIFEAGNVGVDPAYGMVGSGTPDQQLSLGRPDAAYIYPIFPVRDGYVRICILAVAHWTAMLEWLDHPPELADPGLAQVRERQEQRDLVLPVLARHFASMTRTEAVDTCRAHRIPAAAVDSPADVVANPQFRADGIIHDVAGPDGQTIALAEGMVQINGTRSTVDTSRTEPASALLPARDDTMTAPGASLAQASDRYPLHGLTVIDLGIIVAGAEVGRLFAELGARVIRIENRDHLDGMRRGDIRTPTPSLQRGHGGKEMIGLDLQSEEGRGIVHDLVRRADVVTSNFKPGTVEKLGLDFETLREVNPSIVCVQSSAFGTGGPSRTALGYGPLVRSAVGQTWLWRESADSDYFADGITIYPDHVVARIAASAAMACLLDRRRTGAGAVVDIAQSEATLTQLAEIIARMSIDSAAVAPPGRLGHHQLGELVHAAAGDDQWCVIDPQTPAQRDALVSVIGHAEGPDLTTAVAAWVSRHDPDEVMCRMQRAGVPAGRMERVVQLPTASYLGGDERYLPVGHTPEGELLLTERFPVRSAVLPQPCLTPMADFGSGTRSVLTELGYADEVIDRWFAIGVAQELPSAKL